MPFTQDKYTRAYDLLAKVRGEQFGEQRGGHQCYPIGPRWFSDHGAAFELMAAELDGYYETRKCTPEHCFVIGHGYGEAVVVRLREHGRKTTALSYAIVLAVTAKALGRLQKRIDEFAAPAVYQQATLRPGVKPRHDWLEWLNKPLEQETVYRGVYPEEKLAELRALAVRTLEPSDVPGMMWDERLAQCQLRADGAIIHPRDHELELGSLDDGGGITWILLPKPLLA